MGWTLLQPRAKRRSIRTEQHKLCRKVAKLCTTVHVRPKCYYKKHNVTCQSNSCKLRPTPANSGQLRPTHGLALRPQGLVLQHACLWLSVATPSQQTTPTQQTTNRQPTDNQQTTNRQPTDNQQTTNRQPTDNQQTTNKKQKATRLC